MQYSYPGQAELDAIEQQILVEQERERQRELRRQQLAAVRASQIGLRGSRDALQDAIDEATQHVGYVEDKMLYNMLPDNPFNAKSGAIGTAIEAAPWLMLAARAPLMMNPWGAATGLGLSLLMGSAVDDASNKIFDMGLDGLSSLMSAARRGGGGAEDFNDWDAITPNVDMNIGYTTP